MPSEQLTYEQLAERLGITREAARAIVKRQRLPRSKGNDGKTLVTVDLDELRHKPMSGRSPGGDPAVTTTIAALKVRIETLEAELAAEQERSAGHRADFERERDRADRMVTTHDRLVTDGIYGVIRHPSYLGLLLTSLGWGLAFRSGVGLLLTLATTIVVLGRISAEERLLGSHFGAEYEAYRRHTARLIPGIY